MWLADIYFDLAWLRIRNWQLGEPRARFGPGHSKSTELDLTFLVYGDDALPRHLRVLLDARDTSIVIDKALVDRCVAKNVHTWIMSLESFVTLETGQTFTVERIPGRTLFCVTTGECEDGTEWPVTLEYQFREPKAFRYEYLQHAFSMWSGDLEQHLFYFRRFIDGSFRDQQWLAGYRLLEWHFVGRTGSDLPKSEAWRTFLERFRSELGALAKPGQTLHGLMEEIRALAAHAVTAHAVESASLQREPNLIEQAFPTLERMVMTVINEHPTRARKIDLAPRTT